MSQSSTSSIYLSTLQKSDKLKYGGIILDFSREHGKLSSPTGEPKSNILENLRTFNGQLPKELQFPADLESDETNLEAMICLKFFGNPPPHSVMSYSKIMEAKLDFSKDAADKTLSSQYMRDLRRAAANSSIPNSAVKNSVATYWNTRAQEFPSSAASKYIPKP